MIDQPHRGPIVIDTDVYGAELVPGSKLAALYEPIIVGPPAFISFQTVAELQFGALLRNWGEARLRKLDARIAAAETVHTRSRPCGHVRPSARRLRAHRARTCPAPTRR